jgi:mono/diheme cytochrome c family protein
MSYRLPMLLLRRGRKSRSFGVVIGMSLALATLLPQISVAAASDEPDLPQAGQDIIATPGSVVDGQKLFGLNCTYCHGARGAGGRGKPLQCRDDLTAAAIYQAITEGRESAGLFMPSWKASIAEPDRWRLAAYILSLRNLPNCQ